MLGLRRGALLPEPEWRKNYLLLRRSLATDSSAKWVISATDRSSFLRRVRRLFTPETATNAPNTIIEGTVVDATTGNPLIGTSVLIKGTNTGSITDKDGTFRLQWDGSDEMTFAVSYVGYVS